VSLCEGKGGSYREALAGVTVFDDGAGRDQEDTIAVTDRIRKEYGLSVGYAGFVEKKALAAKIAGSDAALSELLDFAFWGIPDCGTLRADGMNRNAILLSNPGKKLVCADDDTVFHYRSFKHPESIQKIRSNTANNPAFFMFSEDGFKHFEKQLVPYNDNPFEDFDRILGAEGPSPAGIEGQPQSGRKTLVAMAGIYGGRWFSSPLAVMEAEPGLQALMWKNRRDYEEAKTKPHALLLSPQTSYSGGNFFVACHFGYDASSLLPPFLPHIRNDDGIWAGMMRMCYPWSPIAYLPFALEHAPHPPFIVTDSAGGSFRPNANSLINFLLNMFFSRSKTDSAEKALSVLGTELQAAASMGEKSWQGLLMEAHLSAMASHSLRLEYMLDESLNGKYRARPYWVKGLEVHIENMKQLCGSPWVPSEFLSFGDKGAALFREYLLRTGELFEAWPEIWKRALEAAS
jgi:hypothetical protein